ncbi:MAG TPA: hypothetical protein VFU21_08580 [Kofleriaceae bacterium]|nr:hypothetical protein [Kofleriaceae bacterium]
MALRRLLLVASVSLAACAKSPTVPDPGRAADAGTVYADVVLAFTSEGAPQVCAGALPACDAEPGEPCGPAEVLGPPDDMTHALEAGGRLDVGFRCGAVVEKGGQGSPDVQIWADVTPGASAVIEVSEDGATYEVWNNLTETDQAFDLATIERTYIRYLRIADTGGGGINIDAVEGI